jgi:hypothetical protein
MDHNRPAPGATGGRAGGTRLVGEPPYTARSPRTQSARNQALPTLGPFFGLKVSNWQPAPKASAYRGNCTVEFAFGLEIKRVPIMSGPYGLWAGFPSELLRDAEGRPLPDPNRPGRNRYTANLKWTSREQQDGWSAAVLDALKQAFGQHILSDGGQ